MLHSCGPPMPVEHCQKPLARVVWILTSQPLRIQHRVSNDILLVTQKRVSCDVSVNTHVGCQRIHAPEDLNLSKNFAKRIPQPLLMMNLGGRDNDCMHVSHNLFFHLGHDSENLMRTTASLNSKLIEDVRSVCNRLAHFPPIAAAKVRHLATYHERTMRAKLSNAFRRKCWHRLFGRFVKA